MNGELPYPSEKDSCSAIVQSAFFISSHIRSREGSAAWNCRVDFEPMTVRGLGLIRFLTHERGLCVPRVLNARGTNMAPQAPTHMSFFSGLLGELQEKQI